jgi:hypothetical protein
MRACKLTNGETAIPVRIEFLMVRDDLINALAWDVRHTEVDELPELNRAQAVERVRFVLQEAGLVNLGYWHDHAIGREERIGKWAKATVDRTFGPLLDAIN